MANSKEPYQSTHSGAEIDAGINLLDKNTGTQGQVLTANGTGGASWQNASGGTKVVANPSLSGAERNLTGLEVAGTKYKVPSGGSGGGGTQLYMHVIEGTDNNGETITVNLLTTLGSEMSSIEDLGKEPILSVGFDAFIGNCICTFDGGVLYIEHVNVVEGGFSRTLLTEITSDRVEPL